MLFDHSMTAAIRNPTALLERARAEWGGRGDLWVFGYASLIWRPDLAHCEQRTALVQGWHRTFQMRSRVNRGTPERPGLVFALVSGGSCRGIAYRIPHGVANDELTRLWQREMPNGVYDARWLACRTPAGPVRALAFTLSRRSPNFTGPIDDAQMLQILRLAQGRYGSTLDYLLQTAQALRAQQLRDREIERLVALACGQGLVQDAAGLASATPSRARTAVRSASVSMSCKTPASSSSSPNDG